MAGLASEVRFQEEAPVVRRIDTGAVLALGVTGIAERGPVDEPVLANSFAEYKKKCGGYTTNDVDCTAAVQGFFDNGGTLLWFNRVVHHTTPGDPTTKTSAASTLNLLTAAAAPSAGSVTGSISGPYDLEPGDTIVVSIDAGADATVTITATSPARVSAAEPFALSNNQTLQIAVNGGGTFTKTFLTAEFVAIGAATAEEVVASLNAFFAANTLGCTATATGGGTTVTITSNRRGTGSIINIVGGTANVALAFTTGALTGTGNVSNVDAVTATEIQGLVSAAIGGTGTASVVLGAVKITSATTGGSSSVQVKAASTADDELGFDNAVHSGGTGAAVNTLQLDGKTDGAYGNDVSVIVATATSGDADRFNLYVSVAGAIKERFVNVTMDDADARYVETIVNDPDNGSDLIAVTDLDAAVSSPGDRPNSGTFGPMTGGDDGLTSLDDTDFIGAEGVSGSTGFRVFDEVDVDVLITPGRATSAVHNAMITYCEITRAGLAFSILDPPANTTAAGMVTYVKSTASIYQLSEYAAIYWPRIKVINPDKTLFGQDKTITVPPSGMVAGVYARVDAAKIGGAFDHPAGTDPLYLPKNVLGLETKEVLKKPKRELVFPSLINPISKEDGPIFIDGARCLKDNGNWPTIGQRRGIIFIEKKLIPGLAFMRHRNIKPRLYKSGELTVTLFMNTLTGEDAFKSKVPSEAYFVDFGAALNPPSAQKARTVYARLGVATSEPAEFIVINISPDTRALDEELAALAA